MLFDTIVKDATIIDGTGARAFNSDVAFLDGKIEKVAPLNGAKANHTIDGRGKVLCPGFVDAHSHADIVLHWERNEHILEPLLRQGITTFVGGNCGYGMAPITAKYREQAISYLEAVLCNDESSNVRWNTTAEMMEQVERKGAVMNCAFLAPHGMMRIAASGLKYGPLDPEQMRHMRHMLAESLEAGVVGMSTGLQYFPGLSADEEELTDLARLLAPENAVLTSHLRSYTNTLNQAIDEIISVGKNSGARVQLSHMFYIPHYHQVLNRALCSMTRMGARVYKRFKVPVPLWLMMQDKLEKISREIERGLDMGVDALPTGAGYTHAFAFFPPWSLEGSKAEILARLADKNTRQEIYSSIVNGKSIWPHRERDTWSMNFFKVMGFQSVYLMSAAQPSNQRYVGKHFAQIGAERGRDPFNALCDMLLEEDGKVLVFETPTWPGDEFSERSLYSTLTHPHVSIATDAVLIGRGLPSHLFYDCYPKVMSKYVREGKMMTLEEAIRKSTSLPAQQMGIRKRGEIREGFHADLVLFDADTIDTQSTPQNPDRTPVGIDYVWVNGQAVVTPDGFHPDPRAGKVIRRND